MTNIFGYELSVGPEIPRPSDEEVAATAFKSRWLLWAGRVRETIRQTPNVCGLFCFDDEGKIRIAEMDGVGRMRAAEQSTAIYLLVAKEVNKMPPKKDPQRPGPAQNIPNRAQKPNAPQHANRPNSKG